VRHCECRYHSHEGAETAQGNHQAHQEQQVVGPVQNVEEAQFHEPGRSLAPARVQRDQPRIAGELISANRAARRQEPKHRDDASGQMGERGMDGKARSVRADRVFEKYFEQYLVPDHMSAVRELRPGDVRQRRFKR
jgi:hypothetical protein